MVPSRISVRTTTCPLYSLNSSDRLGAAPRKVQLTRQAWYILYHGWILLLCLMLIGDELFNVRMGLFAPQWGRAGTGYTIML